MLCHLMEYLSLICLQSVKCPSQLFLTPVPGGRGGAYTGAGVSIAYCTDVCPKPVYAACYSKRLLLQMFLL